jgi:hypothetical protein
MIKRAIVLLFIIISGTAAIKAQNLPAEIVMKDGKRVNIHHLGQATCNGDIFHNGYLLIIGEYDGMKTELKDFSKIKSIELIGFEEEPSKTDNNEKANIRLEKTNGVIFTLENAEIGMACYGAGDKHNQLKLQVINPVTEKADEKLIDTKEISRIIIRK